MIFVFAQAELKVQRETRPIEQKNTKKKKAMLHFKQYFFNQFDSQYSIGEKHDVKV